MTQGLRERTSRLSSAEPWRTGAGRYDGLGAALPLAAAVTLAVSRALPVSFEYVPNQLGIVSIATEQRYPIQQETFWLIFAVALGALLAVALARILRRGDVAMLGVAGAEALAAGALLAGLWLPALVAASALGLAFVGAVALLGIAPSEPATVPTAPMPFARGGLRGAAWIGVVLLLPLLLAPGLWPAIFHTIEGVDDLSLTADHFRFQAENGQHLAWTHALSHGELHGRDFFCLYGPLFHFGLLGFWTVLGRSISAFELYWSLTGVLAFAALLGFGATLLRRRWLALLLPFVIPVIRLRVGLPLLGFWCLVRWLRGGSASWAGGAGLFAGAALTYSQEFGIAFVLPALLALGIRGDWRAALAFSGGGALAVVPVVLVFAAGGALGPMLADLIEYPSLMLAGYAKLPFPSLVAALPLSAASFADQAGLHVRLGYAAPVIGVAALLLALPLSELDLRRPLVSLAAMRERLARDPERLAIVLVALFGLLSFRSALGRSDLLRVLTALPAPAILFCVALDRALDGWGMGEGKRVLAAWHVAALGLFAVHAGLFESAAPIQLARTSLRNVSILVQQGSRPVGSSRVARVVRFIRVSTTADEPVLFLPNNAAYYYLTDRRNPIRFALASQIVTDAHRAEVYADLLRDPPRYVVWDTRAMNVDGVPEAVSLGPEVMAWLESHYREEKQIDGVRLLERRAASTP